MRRLAVVVTVSLIAACSVSGTHKVSTTATPTEAVRDNNLANGTVCRIGPDGGPVVVDRGIGGTGIVGVITGFASICVNGLEVQYDNSGLVDIDGVAASTAALRVGQVVVIQAHGPETAPVATSISVRREVVGRIEAIELEAGMLTIAGQPVAVSAETRGANTVRLGDWVSVSGLRESSGTLVASRLDAAASGTFTVHGQVVRDNGAMRVGSLTLTGAALSALADGQSITVSGRYVSGQAQVTAAAPDRLASNPGDYFGPGVKHLVVEAFVRVTNGSVWLNGLKVHAAPGVSAAANTNGIAIVSLERTSDGSFTAVGVRYTHTRAIGAGRAKASAGVVRGDTVLASPWARHDSPPAVTPADDTDGVTAATAPASAADILFNPASTTGSAGGTSPAATALSVPVVPANIVPSPEPTAPAANVGEAGIESVSPGSVTSTNDLISSNKRAGNSAVVSSGASWSSHGAAHAVVVSSPTSASTVNLATSVTTHGVTQSASGSRVVVSAPKVNVADRGKTSSASTSRQGGD
ncbi:MAG TPA: hypothetical protein DDZ81_02880 [Acetobacteraceae bacterium]|nr:hypothetical protein [Acetobacteraceae bacterium]